MKIINIHIAGFRSLREIDMDMLPLNILVGPNACGKSNLLSATELIFDAISGKLHDSIIKKHGGMIPILWNGSAKCIDLVISAQIEKNHLKINYSDGMKLEREYALLTYKTRISHIEKSGIYNIDYEEFDSHYIENKTDQLFLPEADLIRKGRFFSESGDKNKRIVDNANETIISQLYSSGENLKIFRFVEFCKNWKFYYHLNSNSESEARQSTVARSEKQLEPHGDNLIAVLHTLYTGDKEFRRQLNDTLSAAFGDDFEELTFPPMENGRIYMRWRSKSLKRELSASDLSDGTILFLMLATILLNPDPPTLICIDEPELGLHPSMLHIIAELIKDASNRTQLIISTHSPELVSEFSDMPQSVVVMEKENGATTVKRLDKKKLSKWLKEYSLGKLWLDGEIGG